jgi:hypothetical protein
VSNAIAHMLDFVNTGSAASPEIAAAAAEIGLQEVRVISIKILSWLKSQARRGKPRPLELNSSHRWCQNVFRLMEMQAFLADLICHSDGKLAIRPDLEQERVTEIFKFVDAQYRPLVMD